MKKWVLVFLVLAAMKLTAQTNIPIRLAIVSEADETRAAADVLTAQLSGNQEIHLLERDEIEKVYREQGLSAANRDDLKLGRILGADGLLLLNVVRTPQATNLMTRLIAVKPGVVLTDGSFPWPLKDTTAWAESVATYLNSFLPKLTVLAKDAIPISVVNLRAAISSAGEKETERDLKLLTIQRLSQERRLFVLERQKIQLLSNEKELKSDESAFWDGSYLLDGIVDQSGYSPKTVTINARLRLPKSGMPLTFEVSGSRTNLSEVVNRLAAKVMQLLNVHPTVREWSAAKEAEQYYREAKWALRWGVYSEAQAAADSAWALGKRDLGCALVRVKSYLMAANPDPNCVEQGGFYYSPGKASAWHAEMQDVSDRHIATVFQTNSDQIHYIAVSRLPDSRQVDDALHALELYYAFSRSSPDGEPKILTKGPGWNDWHNSDWYNLGVEDLVAASRVLQVFNCDRRLPQAVADKLADLRALARSVAKLISDSPSVHRSYFVGNRVAVYDELANTIGEDGGRNPNIFTCEAEWGCFWQETPEDCIALYRKLMSSPVFCYIHETFWFPSEYAPYRLPLPRVVAWKEADQERIPAVWHRFVQELKTSTNLLLRLEGKALELANSDSGTAMAGSFTNLFKTMFENRDVLVTNNVDILYLDWQTGDLIERMGGDSASATRDSLEHIYYSEYCPKLDAMEQEYRNKTVPALKFLPTFQKQIRYLKDNTPYDFFKFADLFNGNTYSQSQAREILPLIISYKSNLVAQSKHASGMQKGKLKGAIAQVAFLEDDVNRTLHPPAPHLPSQPGTQTPKPARVVKVAPSIPPVANTPKNVSNVILVDKFFAIPINGFVHVKPSEQIVAQDSTVKITAHQWFAGKLLLDFNYGLFINAYDSRGNLVDNRTPKGTGIAIFDPKTGDWEVIGCPKVSFLAQNGYYHRSALLNGNLFNCDGGHIMECNNFMDHEWKVLKISDGNNYELFVVNGHLYAANNNVIFEIIENGHATRIVASRRRRPPLSALDTKNWGTPILLAGLDHSLRVMITDGIFTWTGNDWRKDSPAPRTLFLPQTTPEGVIYYADTGNWPNVRESLTCLPNVTNSPELYLEQEFHSNTGGNFFRRANTANAPEPLWKMPSSRTLVHLPAAISRSRLFLLASHSRIKEIANNQQELVQEKVVTQNGYNAVLLCFSHGLPNPQKLLLKFDAPGGCPPSAGIDPNSGRGFPAVPPAWMLFANNYLFFGLEDPRNSIPAFNQADRIGIGYKAGVWLLPISQIKPVVNEQRQVQRAEMEEKKKQAVAAEAKHRKVLARQWQNLLTKYDLNHNGRIDPDEKEAALANPIFIKSELGTIDTNHNGRLDAEELRWFDANQNKILDPPEETGIETAQKLLAAKLIKDFDRNGDGQLDPNEFAATLVRNSITGITDIPGNPPLLEFSMYDRNHDHELDAHELQSYLKQHTMQGVRGRIFQTDPRQMRVFMRPSRPSFKQMVEIFWNGLDQSPPRHLSFDQTNQAQLNLPPQ